MSNTDQPPDVSAAMHLAVRLYKSGDPRQSVPVCMRVLSMDPDNPEALHLLGLIAHQMGKNETAVGLIERAIGIRPEVFLYHYTAGNVYLALNEPDTAIACYKSAIALNPAFHEAHNNLGVLMLEQGNLDEAIACFDRALALKSDFYEAYNNSGNALKEQGKLDEAIARYRRAIALKPDFHEAYNNLGVALTEQGRLDEAMTCFERAIALNPDYHEAYNNLGVAFTEDGKLDEAMTCYERAIALKPDYHEAYNNLGNVMNKAGKFEEAGACYRKSIALRPNDGIRIKAATLLPVIMPDKESISFYRRRIEHFIDMTLYSGAVINDPLKDVGQTNFYLAYHGLGNKDLQVKIAKLYINSCPSLLYVAPHCKNGKRAGRSGKIRIGFISSNFCNIAVGKHFRGIIANISRELFEVYVFFGKRKFDGIAQFIESNADIPVTLSPVLETAREQITACGLDILFYTDIGMDPLTYFLAFSRLAPVQCVTWGHPDTTGIPNMDYYISCEDFEAEGSETQYSESLVRMKNIPNYFYRPDGVSSADARQAGKRAGLPDGNRLYVVPQSLFKFHPGFDAVLGEILRADSKGLLVLFEASQKPLGALLMDRFRKSIPDAAERIIFLPRLPLNEFLGFISSADAVLDTPYFCGGTTSLEMFSAGCPIVTWPGSRMASRFTYAYYRKMDIMDLVCEDGGQYVRQAVRLANNADWRKQISEKILERHGIFYDNPAPVRELEQFLLSVCKSSGQN